MGAKCRILQSLPTRTPVEYRDKVPKSHTSDYPTSLTRTPVECRDRVPKAHTNDYLTSPTRTPVEYRRRPSVQAYPWRSLTTDTAF